MKSLKILCNVVDHIQFSYSFQIHSTFLTYPISCPFPTFLLSCPTYIHSRMRDLYLKYDPLTRLLQKPDSPSLKTYQLPRAPWLELELCAQLSRPSWNMAQVVLEWVLCILSAMNFYVLLPCYVWKALFLEVFYHVWLLYSFLICKDFRDWGDMCVIYMLHFGLSIPRSLILCTLTLCLRVNHHLL